MDFNFSDDQQQLRDAVARWVDKRYSQERRRSIVEKDGGFSREAWDELASLGLTGLAIPEDGGGLGLGPVDAMVVLEELGRGIVLEPLAQAFIAGTVLSGYAPQEVQDAWLSRIAGGQAFVVLAYQERRARYRLDVVDTIARAAGDGWTLSGTKSLVPAGDGADAFIVSARIDAADGPIGLFLVERTASGVTTQGYGTQDGSRAAEVVLANAPAALVVRDGLPALEHAADIGIAAVAAEAIGAMEKTLALTVDYLNTRKQFGVLIGSFQALRHRVADMKTHLELARSMSYYITLKLQAPAAERKLAASRAKVQLGQALRFVGQQSVQLHGGIGVTDEYAGSHYFKKLTQLEFAWGDSLHHLANVSDHLQDTAGVFA